MGILRFNGTPYEWNESIPHVPYVKEHGITQFLEIYQNFVHRDNDDMLWGDEIEYMLLGLLIFWSFFEYFLKIFTFFLSKQQKRIQLNKKFI